MGIAPATTPRWVLVDYIIRGLQKGLGMILLCPCVNVEVNTQHALSNPKS